MRMRQIKGVLLAAALSAAVAVSGLSLTQSFLTDYDEKQNDLTPGTNVTTITEDFPDPPVQDPRKDPSWKKTVQIKAPALADAANVTCYVRARILFSNAELGNAAVLKGRDAAWIAGEDGYYYYSLPLKQGETTAPLFTEVAIDSSRVPDYAKNMTEDFRISVYEESVQAGNSGGYQEAFRHFFPEPA